MGRRVLRRVLRRGSEKGFSRKHLEGRNTPFRECGVRPTSCLAVSDRCQKHSRFSIRMSSSPKVLDLDGCFTCIFNGNLGVPKMLRCWRDGNAAIFIPRPKIRSDMSAIVSTIFWRFSAILQQLLRFENAAMFLRLRLFFFGTPRSKSHKFPRIVCMFWWKSQNFPWKSVHSRKSEEMSLP